MPLPVAIAGAVATTFGGGGLHAAWQWLQIAQRPVVYDTACYAGAAGAAAVGKTAEAAFRMDAHHPDDRLQVGPWQLALLTLLAVVTMSVVIQLWPCCAIPLLAGRRAARSGAHTPCIRAAPVMLARLTVQHDTVLRKTAQTWIWPIGAAPLFVLSASPSLLYDWTGGTRGDQNKKGDRRWHCRRHTPTRHI